MKSFTFAVSCGEQGHEVSEADSEAQSESVSQRELSYTKEVMIDDNIYDVYHNYDVKLYALCILYRAYPFRVNLHALDIAIRYFIRCEQEKQAY